MVCLCLFSSTTHEGGLKWPAESWAVSALVSNSVQQEKTRRPKQLWCSGPRTSTAFSSGGMLHLMLGCSKDQSKVSILMSPLGAGKHLVLEAEFLVSFAPQGIQLQATETALQTKPMWSKRQWSEDSKPCCCLQPKCWCRCSLSQPSFMHLKLCEVNPDKLM